MDRSDVDTFLLLVELECDAMARMAELQERIEDRMQSRGARRPMTWQASADESDDDATLEALYRFMPTAWWRWPAEYWERRRPPREAL